MKLSKIKHTNILLLLILIVAAFLRFYQFGTWSLSNDELSALSRLQFESFSDLIEHGVKLTDFHPAGVQVFLWYWVKLFGNDIWVVRLPFVVFGILSVYFVFLIGKRWFNETVGLLAAATFAVLQYPILYSQLARPYSPGLFFSLLTVWFWTKIVFDKQKRFVDYAGFSLFATFAAYTHHYSFLFVLMVGITGLIFLRGKKLWLYLAAGVAVAILYLPHLQVFMYQFGIGGVGGEEGWLGRPGRRWIFDYLHYAFNDSWIASLIVVGLGMIGFIINPVKRPTRFQWIAISWFTASFLIGFLYSILRNPILQFSILLFAFPFLILAIFSFYTDKASKVVRVLVPAIMLFGSQQIVQINEFYKQQHFGEFKGVAQKIADWNNEFGKEEVTNTVVANNPFYIHYYLDRMMPGIEFAQYDNRGGNDFLELKKIVDTSKTSYFIHAWTKPCPPEINDIIQRKYPCKIQSIYYSDLSEVTLFSIEHGDSCMASPTTLAVFTNDFENGIIWGGDPAQLDTTFSYQGSVSYGFDAGMEYGPAFQKQVNEINQGKFKRVKGSLFAYAKDTLNDTPVVITIEDEAGNGYYWAASKIENFVEPRQWDQVFFDFEVPEIRSSNDKIKIFVWNAEGKRLNIDEVEIKFYLDWLR
jgi:uncharacterized membrane protein